MIILEITEWIIEAFMLGIFMIGGSIFMFILTLAVYAIKDRKQK